MYRDRAERAEQRKMDFHAKEVERIDHPRRASLEPNVMPEPLIEEKGGEDQPSALDTKRALGEPEQHLSGEIPIPSADETLTPPEIPAVPSSSTPSSSTAIPISPGASSRQPSCATQGGRCTLCCHLRTPCQPRVDSSESLIEPCTELVTPR